MYKAIILCLSFILLNAGIAHATTIYVPDDYSTIQAAIDAANNGDTIIVRPGTYGENLLISNKTDLTLMGSGALSTVLWSNHTTNAIRADNATGSIGQLTIRNGGNPIHNEGGGLQLHGGSDFTVDSCIFTQNEAVNGAAITVDYMSSMYLTNSLIYDNTAANGIGGIYISSSGTATIRNVTVAYNNADWLVGGIGNYNDATVTNCIVWGNELGQIFDAGYGTFTVSYSDIQSGWPGTGNISDNPLFHNSGGGDYHLNQDPCQPGVVNPCVNAGHPLPPMIYGSTRTDDVLDVGVVDMGFHYTIPYVLAVSPDPLVAGQSAVFTVSNGQPDTDTYLIYSRTGPGSVWVNPLNTYIDLANPKKAFGPTQTNNAGTVSWTATVPINASGLNVWLQGAQYELTTNVVATTVQ